MSQFFIEGSGGPPPPPPIATLSGENGPATPPNGTNFNFSGTPGGGYGLNGAIVFSTVNPGEMNAQVQVDNQTVSINIANQLQVGIAGTVTTIDATPTTVITFPVTAGSTVTMTAFFAAINGAPAGVGGTINGTFFRGGGGATLLGVPEKVVRASVSLSTATIDMNVSGNNALITVTGVAATTIEWKVTALVVEKTFI